MRRGIKPDGLRGGGLHRGTSADALGVRVRKKRGILNAPSPGRVWCGRGYGTRRTWGRNNNFWIGVFSVLKSRGGSSGQECAEGRPAARAAHDLLSLLRSFARVVYGRAVGKHKHADLVGN